MAAAGGLYAHMAWRVLLDVLARGTFFVVNILVARGLGVADFGKFTVAVALAQIFYVLTDSGIHLQLIKELGESRGRDRRDWIAFFELKMVLMAATLVVFLALVSFMWPWPDTWIAVIALVWMLCNSLHDFSQFICNGLARLDLARRVMLLQRLPVLAGVLVALLHFRTLGGVVVALALGGVAGAIAANIYFFRATGARFSFAARREAWASILGRSIPNGIGSLFGSWYLRIGPLVLAWTWSSQAVGEYSAAFRVFESSYILPAAIMGIAIPHLSAALERDRRDFTTELARVSRVIVPVAIVWTALLVAGSTLIVQTLYGPGFSAAAGILRRLGWVAGMVCLNHLILHLMVIFNRQRRHALHEVIAFVIAIPLTLALAADRGAIGVATALLLTEVLLFVLTVGFLLSNWRRSDDRQRFAGSGTSDQGA